jgi:hypothetical protein
MTDTIQTVKEDIAILQEKLKKLEELDRVKTPAEKAYKEVYGCYPPTTPSVSNSEDERWSAFQKGYNASKEDCKVEEPKPKPETLYDVIYEWKYDTYDPTCDDLVNMIEEWLTDDEFDPNGSVYEYEIGWNEAIQSIKEKLR